jgi:uncharacterized FAD-dependent dehydrogenase
MIKQLTLSIPPEIAYEPERLKFKIAANIDISPERILRTDIIRRSIDARKRQVMVNIAVVAHIDEIDMTAVEPEPIVYQNVSNCKQAVVVGAGPAGLFAALQLIELGIRPIVLERGKDVDSRRRDLAKISRENIVNPESNYCFGEGGAGAYSDGKLYTRSKKRGSVDKVLQIFYQHGAQRDILVDAHPHIGTDKLPVVIKAIRQTIINSGGEVRFCTKVTELIQNDKGEVCGVKTEAGETISGQVILATGHSARDVYRMLHSNGYTLEPKGIAVGVRLEHPQQLIDSIQYHNSKGRGKYLPAAEYTMLTRVADRAVYSFCMCPGGFIIPAASEPGQLVVNGMSPSNRGTRWANSGMVVEILPEDLPDYDKYGELKMMYFQQDIEHKFAEAAKGTQQAPAQRMIDFVNSRLSKTLPETSYAPGLIPERIDLLLPKFIAKRLQRGFEDFGRKARGFLTNEAVLIGDETRTSSPVRIPRDRESLMHITTPGLYPCGEGAGYAGGIVSAAIDGIRCAESLAQNA